MLLIATPQLAKNIRTFYMLNHRISRGGSKGGVEGVAPPPPPLSSIFLLFFLFFFKIIE